MKTFQSSHTTQKICISPSSFIQTILSASESHRIMPYGSWALPPVGIYTLPWRFYSTYSISIEIKLVIVKPFRIHRFQKQPDICQTLVHHFTDRICRRCMNGNLYHRIFFFIFPADLCQYFYCCKFSTAPIVLCPLSVLYFLWTHPAGIPPGLWSPVLFFSARLPHL